MKMLIWSVASVQWFSCAALARSTAWPVAWTAAAVLSLAMETSAELQAFEAELHPRATERQHGAAQLAQGYRIDLVEEDGRQQALLARSRPDHRIVPYIPTSASCLSQTTSAQLLSHDAVDDQILCRT